MIRKSRARVLDFADEPHPEGQLPTLGGGDQCAQTPPAEFRREPRPATDQGVSRQGYSACQRVTQFERSVKMLGGCRRTPGYVVEMELPFPTSGSFDHGAVRFQDKQVLPVG